MVKDYAARRCRDEVIPALYTAYWHSRSYCTLQHDLAMEKIITNKAVECQQCGFKATKLFHISRVAHVCPDCLLSICMSVPGHTNGQPDKAKPYWPRALQLIGCTVVQSEQETWQLTPQELAECANDDFTAH